MTLKVLSSETTLTAATTVNNAAHVRLVNTGATAVVTQRDGGGDVIGSFTLLANQTVTVTKEYSDTLEGGASILATKLAFHY